MYGYGQMVREAREAAGLSQAELAKAVRLTGAHDVSRIESEQKAIDPEIYARLLAQLPTLTPSDLVQAMGFPVAIPIEQRVSIALGSWWERLNPQQRQRLVDTAHALYLQQTAQGLRP